MIYVKIDRVDAAPLYGCMIVTQVDDICDVSPYQYLGPASNAISANSTGHDDPDSTDKNDDCYGLNRGTKLGKWRLGTDIGRFHNRSKHWNEAVINVYFANGWPRICNDGSEVVDLGVFSRDMIF
jgi:hypothetical protein